MHVSIVAQVVHARADLCSEDRLPEMQVMNASSHQKPRRGAKTGTMNAFVLSMRTSGRGHQIRVVRYNEAVAPYQHLFRNACLDLKFVVLPPVPGECSRAASRAERILQLLSVP